MRAGAGAEPGPDVDGGRDVRVEAVVTDAVDAFREIAVGVDGLGLETMVDADVCRDMGALATRPALWRLRTSPLRKVILSWLTNIPQFSAQEKYCLPSTEPLFFP